MADVVRHLKEAIVEGLIGDTDPDILAHAILGVTNSLGRTFVLERAAAPETVADAAVAFCLDGLAAGRTIGARAS